jgi:helix-turn-helix protein
VTESEITVADAARTLGVSERTVWRYLRAGRLTGRTEGEPGFQRTLIDPESLESARAASTSAAPRPDAPPLTDPGAAVEIERLTGELRAAREEAERIGREAARTREELEGLRREAVALRAERDALQVRVARLQRAVAAPRPAMLGLVAERVLRAGARIDERRSR